MAGQAAAQTIEDIILRRDGRSMHALRPHLRPDFCDDAARFLYERPGPALVATGFYILSGGAVETDGPPGAAAIGEALEALGRQVVYVTDIHGGAIMHGLAPHAEVVEFPIADMEESRAFARELVERVRPAVAVAIERCSITQQGLYRNMRSLDISAYTAKVDPIFDLVQDSVGIGDGGNEIGMGALAEQIRGVEALPDDPSATACSRLVISSVSNWGGYGLVASLSKLAGRNLLPSVEREAQWVRTCVDLGGVDGSSGKPIASVDGFPLDENSETLRILHDALAAQGVR